jgi:hypothetical protein
MVILAALAASACGEGERGATMSPGQDCLSCHSLGGSAQEETFSAGGTVYGAPDAAETAGVEGATVTITDAHGTPHFFRTNATGNFYAKVFLAAPLQKVAIDFDGKHAEMASPPPSGACNSCHAQPPQNGAPGRIFVQ